MSKQKRLNPSALNRQLETVRKLSVKRKERFEHLRPLLRAVILRKIYAQANGQYPHKFDPVIVRNGLVTDGYKIDWDLFYEVFDKFGHKERIEVQPGSFNIEHHYCQGEISL